jgi:ATP-dependent Clp protease ATP-binding subunit ClpC
MKNKFQCSLCKNSYDSNKKNPKIAILKESIFNSFKNDSRVSKKNGINTLPVILKSGNIELYEVCENCLHNDVFKFTDELYEKHHTVISVGFAQETTGSFELNNDLNYNQCYCCLIDTDSDSKRNTSVYISTHLIHMIKNNPQYLHNLKINEMQKIFMDNALLVNVCKKCLENEILPRQIIIEEEGINLSEFNSNNTENDDEEDEDNSQATRVIYARNNDENQEAEDDAVLSEFGENLLNPENIDKIKENIIFGRDKEVNSLINILSKRDKNNPLLIGESGVGKTSILHKLCLRIYENDNIPSNLANVKIYSIRISDLLAGTKYRGDLEAKLNNLLYILKNRRDIILFFDEIHTLAGSSSGMSGDTVSIKDILKPALSNGEITCIGATTTSEYKKYIEVDSALKRRFQTIQVLEPDFNECFSLLKQVKVKYESFHGIVINDEIIEESIQLSSRYITDRKLPDKAFDLLDQAGALFKVKNNTHGLQTYMNKNNETITILSEKKENKYKEKIKELKKMNKVLNKDMILNADSVYEVLRDWTGIDVFKIQKEEIESLQNIDKRLDKEVIGQTKVTSIVAKYVQRNKLGLNDHKRTLGVHLLVGPTGTGKTELAKVTNKLMCGNKDLIRFDLSEYSKDHEVSKLIGAPPGYIGYEEGGLLTERVKRSPYGVILLDEIDKAHPDVYNILLQVFDEGFLTDGKGDRVDFKNTMIFMTSNFIIDNKFKNAEIGFTKANSENEPQKLNKLLLNELRTKGLKPEFLNRIDEILLFENLTEESIKKICSLKLNEKMEYISSTNKYIESCVYNDDVVEFLSKRGYDKEYGARPLNRAIESHITNPLTEFLITKNLISKNNKIKCKLSIKEDKVFVETI